MTRPGLLVNQRPRRGSPICLDLVWSGQLHCRPRSVVDGSSTIMSCQAPPQSGHSGIASDALSPDHRLLLGGLRKLANMAIITPPTRRAVSANPTRRHAGCLCASWSLRTTNAWRG